jgi:hypothetical protein
MCNILKLILTIIYKNSLYVYGAVIRFEAKKISGIVDLPLHSGKCPRWLFPLMKNLAREISGLIIEEYGEGEFLKKLSDPLWFQSFGCVLGFDWHSSGLTTTTTGALKEALKNHESIGIAGGKKSARNAPQEIISKSKILQTSEAYTQELLKASRVSAKVDNTLIQDGFQLYHHTIFFTKNSWSVVQQGMNNSTHYARRYHWLNTDEINFTCEPPREIISDSITKPLNLSSQDSLETQKCSLDLIKDHPRHLKKYLIPSLGFQKTLFDFSADVSRAKTFTLPPEHFPPLTSGLKTLLRAYEEQPKNYEELLLIKGMGQKHIRALALISHLVHGTALSWTDPVKYSFAHGGKDGWPFPVDKERMESNTEFLKNAIKDARLNNKEKSRCLRRLHEYYTRLYL